MSRRKAIFFDYLTILIAFTQIYLFTLAYSQQWQSDDSTQKDKIRNEKDAKNLVLYLKASDSNRDLFEIVAKRLGELKDPSSIPDLIDLLRYAENDYIWIKYASHALVEIGEIAIDSLAAALSNENLNIRIYAVETLGRIGGKKVVPFIRQAMHDEHIRVRQEATSSFIELEMDANNILQYLTTPNNDIVDRALNPKDFIDDRNRKIVERAIKKLGELKDPISISYLINLLNKDFKWAAIEALTRIGDIAVDSLGAALDNEDSRIRFNAVSILGQIGESKVIPFLKKAMNDKDPEVRYVAIYSYIRLEEDINKIIPYLNNSDIDIAIAAIERLGELKNPASISYLIDMFDHKENQLRSFASYALIKMGEITIDSLEAALDDESSNIRSLSIRTLGRFGGDKLIKLINITFQDTSKDVRLEAIIATGFVEDSLAIPILRQGMDDKDQFVRKAATLLLIEREKDAKNIIPYLKDPDRDIVEKAIDKLGELKDPNSIPSLIDILEREDMGMQVFFMLEKIFKEIKDPTYIPPLVALLGHKNDMIRTYASQVLIQLGETAVDSLIAALDNENIIIRTESIRALGSIGNEKALEPLIEFLQDTSKNVRSTAILATQSIAIKRATVRDGLVDKVVRDSLRDSSLVSVWIQAMNDEESEVRASAARALGKIDNTRLAQSVLLNALEDKSPYVQSIAMSALADMKSPDAILPLINRMKTLVHRGGNSSPYTFI